MPQPPLNDQYTQQGWVSAAQMYATIGGKPFMLDNGSFKVSNAIGQRSTFAFTLDDVAGSFDLHDGTLVNVWQSGSYNLLSPNQSDVEIDLTGLSGAVTGHTATLTWDNTQAWQGIGSVNVVTDGTQSGQGVFAALAVGVAKPSTTYTVSAWVNGNPGDNINISLYSDSGGTIGTFVTTTLVAGWQRIQQTATTASSLSGNIGIFVRTNGMLATTFNVDGLQVELGSQANTWALGGYPTGSLLFAGPLTSAKRTRIGQGSTYIGVYPVQCQAADWHYLADKRIVASAYQYQTCGYMVRDLVDNVLSQEGVTYQRGINLLTAQQSNVESSDMTPFAVVNGATLSQDTTAANVHTGTGALKVVTPGAANFEGVNFFVPVAKLQTGQVYTFSAWMKASSGTPTIRFFCVDNTGTTIGQAFTATLSTTYTRYQFSATLPSSFAGKTGYGFAIDTGGSHQALTWWVDASQIELGPAATNWSLGGTGSNLLSANQSSVETDTTGLASIGTGVISLSRDQTQMWSGQSSLKVVTDGAATGQGFKAALAVGNFTADKAYAFSVWLYGSGTVRLFVRDESSPGPLSGAPTTVVTLGQFWQRVQVTVQMPHSLNAGGYALAVDNNGTAVALTFYADGLQVEQRTATNWESGDTIASVQDGPTVINYEAPYTPASKALDDLAQLAGFYWQIDQNKVMWFLLPTTIPAPFTYDGTQGVYGTQSVDISSPLYRNSQWLLNIPDVTALQTETRNGDGTTRAFPMSYPFNNVPKVTLNGGSFAGQVAAYKPSRYYRLDDPSGTTMTDTGTSPQNGTYVNSPTLAATGLLTGDADTAVSFNGTTQYATLPTTGLVTGNGLWSLVALVKPTSVTPAANAHILTLGNPGTNGQAAFIALMTTSNWACGTWGGGANDTPSSGTAVSGHVYAVFGTYDGTSLRLYVGDITNGDTVPTLLATTAVSARNLVQTSCSLGAVVITAVASRWFPGTIDEGQIYSGVALTQTQINRIYQQAQAGATQSVGIKGVDDTNHTKNWYWSEGDPVLAQETNDPVLQLQDSVQVQYIGQWVSNVYSQSPSLVASRSTIDGTSGVVEEAHNDPTIKTSSAGFSLAAALLNRYGIEGKQIVFQTRVGGLAPGQLLNITMLSAGWKLSSVQALIEQVDITIAGQWFVYTITAIVGPVNQNWVQFFQKLAGVGVLIPGSAGSNQNVSLLAAFAATWGWAATFAATVTTCPIIASSLHCGPTVIVC